MQESYAGLSPLCLGHTLAVHKARSATWRAVHSADSGLCPLFRSHSCCAQSTRCSMARSTQFRPCSPPPHLQGNHVCRGSEFCALLQGAPDEHEPCVCGKQGLLCTACKDFCAWQARVAVYSKQASKRISVRGKQGLLCTASKRISVRGMQGLLCTACKACVACKDC